MWFFTCLFEASNNVIHVMFSSTLQPLMDNLESQTYEVFEKDPIKYSQYQQVRPSDAALAAPVKTFQSTRTQHSIN